MATPSGDQRRTEILDAVVRVIIDIGFTEMTVADVAQAAGVSNALVHYHFTSKPELIEAALQVASLEDQQFRESVMRRTGSATARLDGVLCESLPSDASDASWLLWIETWGETRRNPAIRAVMADLDAHEVDAVIELIREGNAAGEFACADAAGAAAQLTALRDGLAIDRTLFHEHLPFEQLADQLRRAIRFNLDLAPARYDDLLGRQ